MDDTMEHIAFLFGALCGVFAGAAMTLFLIGG